MILSAGDFHKGRLRDTMRIFHLSDLHIGKQFYGYSLLDDQVHILKQVLRQVERRRPDVILLAGDIYDKSVPSQEAVEVFDRFLSALAAQSPAIPVLIISGNHDSPQRLVFGADILSRQQIYLAGFLPTQAEERLKKVTLQDAYGEVDFWLFPFLRASNGNGSQLFREVLEREETFDPSKRNVLLAHQFFTSGDHNPARSDSETIFVGGLDQVDAACLELFDYAALGHIHRAQSVGRPSVRYCGTLLKYSVSEWNQEKSLTEVELGEKGKAPEIHPIVLKPLRDVKCIRGTLEEILKENAGTVCEDYVSITLTDERELYQPKERLETVFTHILEVRTDRGQVAWEEPEDAILYGTETPVEIFCGFFQKMQNRMPDQDEMELLEAAFGEAGKEA